MKTKLLLLLMFVVAVLAASSSLIEAEADDTYNFYFQKAPGPTTVNQGTSGQTAGPSKNPDSPSEINTVVPPSGGQPVATAAPQSVASAPAAEDERSYASRPFEFSLGYAGSKFNGGGTEDEYGRPIYQPRSSSMINGNQYSAGLQWNPTDLVGLQMDAYYLIDMRTKNSFGQLVKSKGSPLDYGASLVITPLRLQLARGIKLNLGAMLGGMTVPFHQEQWSGDTSGKSVPEVAHAGSFAFGARLGLELSNRIALNATVRKITRFESTHAMASLAYLF